MASALVWQQKMAVTSSNAVALKAVLVLPQQFTLNKNSSDPANGFRLILAFGSNLGNCELNLDAAIEYLENSCKILSCSQRIKTKPLQNSKYDTTSHNDYLNFVAEIQTYLTPYIFYENVIVPIENKLGHCRKSKWMPRALDIDVLLAAKNDAFSFEECSPIQVNINNFYVPHLEFHQRQFWHEMLEAQRQYVPKR